ncbi:hypothetical protein C0J52_22661 [Blattella germanica]|nr:hypothetical protein C0J52_22661 [Blattella germanica]
MFLPKIQVETIMQFELIVFALFFLEDTREVPMPQQFPHRGHLEEQGIVEFFDSKIQKASSPQNCTTNEGEEEEVFRTSPHLSGSSQFYTSL